MRHRDTEPIDTSDLFNSLRAEREQVWLHTVFVPPEGFGAFATARSAVIFGDSGSGKTAVRLMLTRYAEGSVQGTGRQFVVLWRPTPRPGLSGTAAAHTLFEQALGECARMLLRMAGLSPERWRQAPRWVFDTAHTIIHSFAPEIQAAPEYHLSRFAEQATPEGVRLQTELVSPPLKPLFRPDIDQEQLIGELVGLVQRLSYEGIWVMVDGLERLADEVPEELGNSLHALFSTLAIFEHPDVAIKMVAPSTLAPLIKESGGIRRRRIDVYDLSWSAQELEQILTRRLALSLGRPIFNLSEIYTHTSLIRWLTDNSDKQPREWLHFGGRLLDAYQTAGGQHPLNASAWRRLARDRQHSLRVDLTTEKVFVDDQEISTLTPASFKLLSYLYEHHGRICTRSELYYRALRGLAAEPRTSDDPSYEEPSRYTGTLDSNLWRLRREIEPNPKQPVFLQVIRGRGVRLKLEG